MSRRAPTLALLGALLLTSLLATTVSAADPPLPASMAAVGDSITQAASSAGSLGADAPQNSWSTGSSQTVQSHALRLQALGAPLVDSIYNRSVSGAKAIDLNGQMQDVADLDPDYVTVLIGGNDLCTDTVEGMTRVTDFRAQIDAALASVMNGTAQTRVYVVSIPDVYQLWDLFKNNFWARFIWSSADICQSLLANPTSTQRADVERRAAVRQRNIDFNAQLAQACAAWARCLFDGNAVFGTPFTSSDVSGDYFHPSVAGQAKLASVSWAAGYPWAATPAENVAPTAAFTASCEALTCSFTDASADSDGTIAAHGWSFGDGTGSTARNPVRTYSSAGSYSVQLTVTDDDGATASATQSVTVSAPASTAMWVSGMSATTTSARNNWTATVTIQVVDATGPLSGVAVSGTWSAGSGATTCTTGVDGRCTVNSSSLNKKTASVSYTVSGLSRSGWTYEAGSNVTSSVSATKP